MNFQIVTCSSSRLRCSRPRVYTGSPTTVHVSFSLRDFPFAVVIIKRSRPRRTERHSDGGEKNSRQISRGRKEY